MTAEIAHEYFEACLDPQKETERIKSGQLKKMIKAAFTALKRKNESNIPTQHEEVIYFFKRACLCCEKIQQDDVSTYVYGIIKDYRLQYELGFDDQRASERKEGTVESYCYKAGDHVDSLSVIGDFYHKNSPASLTKVDVNNIKLSVTEENSPSGSGQVRLESSNDRNTIVSASQLVSEADEISQIGLKGLLSVDNSINIPVHSPTESKMSDDMLNVDTSMDVEVSGVPLTMRMSTKNPNKRQVRVAFDEKNVLGTPKRVKKRKAVFEKIDGSNTKTVNHSDGVIPCTFTVSRATTTVMSILKPVSAGIHRLFAVDFQSRQAKDIMVGCWERFVEVYGDGLDDQHNINPLHKIKLPDGTSCICLSPQGAKETSSILCVVQRAIEGVLQQQTSCFTKHEQCRLIMAIHVIKYRRLILQNEVNCDGHYLQLTKNTSHTPFLSAEPKSLLKCVKKSMLKHKRQAKVMYSAYYQSWVLDKERLVVMKNKHFSVPRKESSRFIDEAAVDIAFLRADIQNNMLINCIKILRQSRSLTPDAYDVIRQRMLSPTQSKSPESEGCFPVLSSSAGH